MGVCVQEPRAKKRNRELHYTEWTTVQDSVDGWRAGEASLRLCVPKTLREGILKACHDDITAGHLGRTRTFDKVQQRYFWNSLAGDVDRYVRACRVSGEEERRLQETARVHGAVACGESMGSNGDGHLGTISSVEKGNRYIVVVVARPNQWPKQGRWRTFSFTRYCFGMGLREA
jgi:hypothetical protein